MDNYLLMSPFMLLDRLISLPYAVMEDFRVVGRLEFDPALLLGVPFKGGNYIDRPSRELSGDN